MPAWLDKYEKFVKEKIVFSSNVFLFMTKLHLICSRVTFCDWLLAAMSTSYLSERKYNKTLIKHKVNCNCVKTKESIWK